MGNKQYSPLQLDLVYDWTEKWFQLVDLIFKLVRTDRSPPSPPPPTELDEINYQRLRFWLIDHEPQFIPLWQDFYRSQDWALQPGDDKLASVPDSDEYLENPFFFCYHPENLYELVRELDIQSGIDMWDPSKRRAWTAAMLLLQMDIRVVEFFEWIDKQWLT